MVRKLCIVNSEEDIKEIWKGIAPLLRHKKRSILIMGGNYEEVNKETQEAKTSTRHKSWKQEVENRNMQIINDNNFVQLNKCIITWIGDRQKMLQLGT